MAAEQLPIGAVVGIVLGVTLGVVVLLILVYQLIRCCLRRRHRARYGSYDLEQPFTTVTSGRGLDASSKASSRRAKGLPTIKESELVVSPNVVAELDEVDQLALGGLHATNGKLQLPPDNGTSEKTRQGSGPMSILRWLESSEDTGDRVAVPQGLSHVQSAHLPPGEPRMEPGQGNARARSFGSKLSALSMRALAERFQAGGDLAEVRSKLLASLGGAGDSAAHPLDVKGIVFSRLPPSRRASPAPSTIESMSTRTPRITRQWEQAEQGLDTEQLSSGTQRSLFTQHSSGRMGGGGGSAVGLSASRASSMTREAAAAPAVPLGSHSGSAYAAIGMLARTSLKRNSSIDASAAAEATAAGLPPRPPRQISMPRTAEGMQTTAQASPLPSVRSQPAAPSPFAQPAGTAGAMPSSPSAPAPQQQVLLVLDSTPAGAPADQPPSVAGLPAGVPLPVSVPAGGQQPLQSMVNPVFRPPAA